MQVRGVARTGSSVYSAATILRAKRGSLASKGYRPYSIAYRITPQLQMSAHCAQPTSQSASALAHAERLNQLCSISLPATTLT